MATTILDALIVRLGLDDSNMKKNSPRAVKNLKDIEKQGAKAESSIGELGKKMGSFLALIGGTMAIRHFVDEFIQANAQLYRLSKNLSLSVSTISAWSNATEQLGGSAAGLQGTMSMLSKSQTQLMLTGNSSLIPYFSALGISMSTAEGKARPVTHMLLDMADRFSHMDRTTANNMGQMMGIDQGTMNLLLQGRKEVELTIARQKEYNVVTEQQARDAQKLQTALVATKQKFAALGRTLIEQATPAIMAIIDAFSRLGTWMQANGQFVKDFFITAAAGVAAFALAALPLTGTVAAITAVAGAIALLTQDFQTWKAGGTSLIDYGKWINEIKQVLPWLDKVDDKLSTLNDWVKKKTGHSITDVLNGTENIALKYLTPFGGMESGSVQQNDMASDARIRKLATVIAKNEGFYAKGTKPNRPQRNNNPGNLKYGPFAARHGGTDGDGMYATFANAGYGMDALVALLKSSSYAGLTDTQIIHKFAPAGPENPNQANYIASVNRAMATPSSTVSHSSASSTNIGTVNIHTNATDATGISRDLKRSLDWTFAAQANTGLR